MQHISVIGPGLCSQDEYREALEVGRLIADHGATLVCGGLGGVMTAAARGAKEGGGSTIGVLPGHDRSAANPYIDVAVTTGLGEARNLVVVSTGDAVIAVGGGFGTLSEIGLAAKIGRPVVILHGWRIQRASLAQPIESIDPTEPSQPLEPSESTATATANDIVHYASSPEEAVELAFVLSTSPPADRPRTSP